MLAVAGLVVFPYLVVGRYGTPFVVAQKIGIGALVFLLGRFAVVAVHETAHGLAMASYGRRVRRAGLKLVLDLPVRVRRHVRGVVRAAAAADRDQRGGPDLRPLARGALRAVLPGAAGRAPLRDIFFQLAFAAYLGAFFNLNPFVERDGYQILVDVLREPGLRRRAREQLRRRLSGQRRAGRLPGAAALRGVRGSHGRRVAACFAVGMSLRYEPRLTQVAPGPVVWAVLARRLGWVSSCRCS